MAVNFQDIVKMAEELSDEQKAQFVVWLLDKIRTRELTIEERLAVFDSLTVDLGAVLPTCSDRLPHES